MTIVYKIIKKDSNINFNSNFWCHIHCFNINLFDKFFGRYIETIENNCSVIVTYNTGDNIPNKNFIYLHFDNRGLDIGGKFVCIHFLKNLKIPYKFILMIHSKSNESKRNIYIKPLVDNLENIKKNSKNDDGIFVHNKLIHPSSEKIGGSFNKGWGRNTYHVRNLIKHYNVTSCYKNFSFPQGNSYIINHKIADILFGDETMFLKLNTKDTFDYSWFTKYYHNKLSLIPNISYAKARDIFKKKKLHGNNISTKLGHKALADSMIEHAFERIVFGLCYKYKKKINILDLSNKNKKFLLKTYNVKKFNCISPFPSNFNWKTYVQNNEDLSYMNENQAISHYINYGQFENRIF